MKACKNKGVPYEVLDKFGNFIEIKDGSKSSRFFINAKTPFNNNSLIFMATDKDFTHRFLKDDIKMPKSISYFNPSEPNKEFTKFDSVEDIAKDIEKNFPYPMIVKMNSGSASKNVFACKNFDDVKNSLNKIFNKKLRDYDFVAIAQELLDKKDEYRVLIFKGEVLVVYKKNKDIFDLEEGLEKEIIDFVLSSNKLKSFEFTGLDVIRTKDNKLYLLEVNTYPSIRSLVKNGGEEVAVGMYEKMLESFQHE